MIEINENFIYEKKVIAFIDFLGYKNLIYRNIDKTTTAIIPQGLQIEVWVMIN